MYKRNDLLMYWGRGRRLSYLRCFLNIGMSQGGQIAETTDEMCRDQEVEKAPTEEEESNEHASLMQSQSSFLLGMNLVMIMASLTLSDQELLDFEDMDNASAKEQHVKASVSRLKKKKEEFHQLKITDQRTPRIPTRVLNSRHGRRM